MIYLVEEIFRTEGVPEHTYVKPPNYNEILVDVRNPGKPVILEGQSGTGKTTTVKKIIEQNLGVEGFEYFSARKAEDVSKIQAISKRELVGKYIIDDFHRLADSVQADIADLIKVAAEENDPNQYAKIVILGINKVGSELIHLVPDIAKRCGIHRIQPADKVIVSKLIELGEEKLSISIVDKAQVYEETNGDYWLTQLLCQTICLLNDITQTSDEPKALAYELPLLRRRVNGRLESGYEEAVKEFCRGKRFRSTNDPYYRLLKCVSEQEGSIVDLTDLANNNPDVAGSINNIKEKRLNVLLNSKPICDRYFYYNSETKNFAIEDPALFYYIKHLDWNQLRKVCGFRDSGMEYQFDFAISFAGENRDLAKTTAAQLETLDCSVFFDEFFESNYLGKVWHKEFEEIFKNKSRFVVCFLDKYHLEKIWTTFERECFAPRISDEAVVPIYLDDTSFPGIPKDVIGIMFDKNNKNDLENQVTDHIVFKLLERIEAL